MESWQRPIFILLEQLPHNALVFKKNLRVCLTSLRSRLYPQRFFQLLCNIRQHPGPCTNLILMVPRLLLELVSMVVKPNASVSLLFYMISLRILQSSCGDRNALEKHRSCCASRNNYKETSCQCI